MAEAPLEAHQPHPSQLLRNAKDRYTPGIRGIPVVQNRRHDKSSGSRNQVPIPGKTKYLGSNPNSTDFR